MDQVDNIVREVLSRLQKEQNGEPSARPIPAEMSARHVHLSTEDLKVLFGIDKLECAREISQPGQFLSSCRLRLIGPKGTIDNVAVLGPTRGATQVEISATDARTLGIQAPVRLSGELQDAAEIALQAGSKIISRKAAIVARRHLHMTPRDAADFHVQNGQLVSVRVQGSRPLILEEVPVRVSEQSALALHIDTDEANAAGLGKDAVCRIISCGAMSPCSASADCSPCTPAGSVQNESCTTLPGKLITEYDIRGLKKQGVQVLCIAAGQIITPLARDTAKSFGIRLEYGG